MKDKRQANNGVFIWIQMCSLIIVSHCSAEQFHWSEKSLKEQADSLGCLPTNKYEATTPKLRNKAANYTMMGKVVDVEVCTLLCCELGDQCNIAWMKDKVCYSVKCLNDECQTEKATGNQTSVVVQIKRNYINGMPSKNHAQKEVTGDKYDENKSTIVTKQAVASKNSVVQKGSVSVEKKGAVATHSTQESLVTITNQSPMEQLLQRESSRITSKATVEIRVPDKQQSTNVKKSKQALISNNIQTLSEHLKKVDEKADITALEENDNRTVHPKHKYHKRHDLRHSLISPIIIGAFTCMAVIAVSGFAMAIIKYQKERHEKLSTQSTQIVE